MYNKNNTKKWNTLSKNNFDDNNKCNIVSSYINHLVTYCVKEE